jgi:hypothetical protein
MSLVGYQWGRLFEGKENLRDVRFENGWDKRQKRRDKRLFLMLSFCFEKK